MTPEKAKALLPVFTAFANGETVQMKYGRTDWEDLTSPSFVFPADDYRVKPKTHPPFPDGYDWHNPDNLTPEQVGTADGWRLMVKGEQRTEDLMWRDGDSKEWKRHRSEPTAVLLWSITYRTKADLPPLPVRVPLGPEDVPPGSVVRIGRLDGEYGWTAVRWVGATEVNFGKDQSATYENLMDDGVEIKRPGEYWQPCSKPA